LVPSINQVHGHDRDLLSLRGGRQVITAEAGNPFATAAGASRHRQRSQQPEYRLAQPQYRGKTLPVRGSHRQTEHHMMEDM
ncbi:MAG: hypothetical protein RL703_881, partial [Pseudomonadota bacterium]